MKSGATSGVLARHERSGMGRTAPGGPPRMRPASRSGPGTSIRDQIAMDERAFELWGVPPRERVTFRRAVGADPSRRPPGTGGVRGAPPRSPRRGGGPGCTRSIFRIIARRRGPMGLLARVGATTTAYVGRTLFGVFLDFTGAQSRPPPEEAREIDHPARCSTGSRTCSASRRRCRPSRREAPARRRRWSRT